MPRAPFLLAAATAAVLAAGGTPADAVDDAKPTACNGLAFADPAGDNASATVPTPAVGSDLLGGFVKHDPAKGDQATTFNLIVKDLDPTVPPGYVTLSWIAYYPAKDAPTRWVRAVADFGGGIAYEYGHVEDAEATTVSLYEGDIEGKMFEGADGVVQLVMPKGDIALGDTLKPVYGNILQGQASLPPQTGAPVRGTSWVMDRGPDTEGAANRTAVVEPCPADGAAPAPEPVPVPTVVAPPPVGSPAPAPAPAPPPPPPTTATPTGSRVLPVKLVTKAIKARKAKRKLSLKLRSSEKVTNLSIQLRKGRKLVGTGKLAQIDGARAVKLKLSKLKKGAKRKRGNYVLDLAGNDAQGKRLLVSFRLKLR